MARMSQSVALLLAIVATMATAGAPAAVLT